MRRTRPLAPLVAVLLLAGCGGGSGGGGTAASTTASGTTSSSSATSSTHSPAPSSAQASWGSLAGCPSVGQAIPAGAVSAPTVDVDGDGRPDTEWITRTPDANGTITFGARTASGGVFSAAINSASPIARQVMFADVTGHGEVIALASDGRQVLLYAVSQCQLIPEKNVQGKQYAFDLGFTGYGTGVGCVDANGDGTTDLVGLKVLTDNGAATAIQRTIVELHGPNARNGATDTVPITRASMADEARSVTCGALTLQANGVSSGP